ncbi:MAG: hypothetical protein JW741_05510 [Sedimentisphaerales bacterium]|nr:hypothetical protein [Sedimentisphaerales bacterium]
MTSKASRYLYKNLGDALLAYLAQDDTDKPEFQSLSRISLNAHNIEDQRDVYDTGDFAITMDQIRSALDQLVLEGFAESFRGERDNEASYRISQDGYYQAAVDSGQIQPTRDETEPAVVSAEAWTGSRRIYVDSGVLAEIRKTSKQLQVASRNVNYLSEEDARDIRGLTDALVGLCEMAQPELGIIDQITAHPKFKIYAALVVFISTIRGALGI